MSSKNKKAKQYEETKRKEFDEPSNSYFGDGVVLGEFDRQMMDYAMANGDLDAAFKIHEAYTTSPISKQIKNHENAMKSKNNNKNKKKEPQTNPKKVQKQRIDEGKEKQKEVRKEVLGFLDPNDINRIHSWVFTLLRRIRNSEEDIKIAAEIVHLQAREKDVDISLEVINEYIVKQYEIAKKYKGLIKKKKNPQPMKSILQRQQEKSEK